MHVPNLKQITANARAGRSDAQFLLSQICRQEGDIEGMVRWLRKASDSGLGDAIGALGQCHEHAQGVSSDMAAALDHYERALQAGSSLAALHKAQLLHKSRRGREDSSQIRRLLVGAAAARIVPAVRTIGYLAMQQEPSRALALDCLRFAAQHGDPVSSFNLGWCLAEGWGGDAARTEAAHWLHQAARASYPLAAKLLEQSGRAAVTPQDTPPASKIDFGTRFPLYPKVADSVGQIISANPPITVFNDVLTVIDCAYLMYVSRPYLKRAAVIDPEGDRDGMVSNVRTNMSTYIPFERVDIISRYVELKIVGATGEDLLRSEPMSVLCYAPGEYYRPHFDYFRPGLAVSQAFMRDGGQRMASAVTYLSVPTEGGGTSFPNLDLTVPPNAGGTLWFRNCFEDGRVDERSLHAGDTVDGGEKWVVTKWFRQEPTRYLRA